MGSRGLKWYLSGDVFSVPGPLLLTTLMKVVKLLILIFAGGFCFVWLPGLILPPEVIRKLTTHRSSS